MDRAKSVQISTAACVEASDAAACEVVDLTETNSSKSGITKLTKRNDTRLADHTNIVDLTDVDNPCYDPAEIEDASEEQRHLNTTLTSSKRTPDTITWDKVYPKLPPCVQHQLKHDKPKTKSPSPTLATQNTSAKGSTTGISDSDEDEYADDILDQDPDLLIQIADRVSSEATSTATIGYSNSMVELEPCPICEKGRMVRTTASKTQPGYRCSNKNCRYEELDY